MITIQGKGVSKGIAKGPLYFFQRSDTTVTLKVVSDIEAEKARLAVAQEQSIRQLNALAEKCQEDAGEEMAALFETHAMFVEDEDFVECITSLIDEESCNAEHAVEQAGIQFAAMFAAMDDEYMKARSADVKDISERLVRNLSGEGDNDLSSMEPSVIVADDLSPSETVQMDKEKILAFVTVHGSTNSHTAILARMMNIPALIGVPMDLNGLKTGMTAVVDGFSGQVIFEPEEDVQKILRAAIEAPTAGNMTLWSAIRVTDEAKKKRLSETCDNQPFIASAPLVLVFCADYKRWYDLFATLDLGEELRKPGEGDLMLAMMDTIIAAHASVVAADALGCGSCYIGDIIERCEQQREILGLPEYVKPVCMVVYGIPTEFQKTRKKPARFEADDIVFENEYQSRDPEQMRRMLENRQDKHGEELERWITAHCKRKWNCDFSREMTRSAAKMIQEWREGK